MSIFAFLSILTIFNHLNSWGQPEIPLGNKGPQVLSSSSSDEYQIGSEWGKKPVNQDYKQNDPNYQSVVNFTARVSGATGFYLGQFNGHHVVATNHHVCPQFFHCTLSPIKFPELGISVRADKFIGTWSDIDLTLITVTVSPEEETQLQNWAKNFSFDEDIYPGQQLITAGFGIANNSKRQLMINMDSDCKVFSAYNEFRHMFDPDQINTGDYKAWSFANGCDVSHGDSGSAMVDRQTGKVVGIIWTGKIPKDERIQDSQYLDQILQTNQQEEIWGALSYAVPAKKMKQHLLEKIDNGELESWKSDLLLQIIQAGSEH